VLDTFTSFDRKLKLRCREWLWSINDPLAFVLRIKLQCRDKHWSGQKAARYMFNAIKSESKVTE
jgi:hypothetical protein